MNNLTRKILLAALVLITLYAAARAQYVDRIMRPCGSGATPYVSVTTLVNGNIALITCVGGQVTINGVAVSPGGGFGAVAANLVFAGPATGAAAAPTFRALVAADIPGGGGGLTCTGCTTNLITKTTGAGTLGNSSLTDTGSAVSFGAGPDYNLDTTFFGLKNGSGLAWSSTGAATFTKDAGIFRSAIGVLEVDNGTTLGQYRWLRQAGYKFKAGNFDATATTTLASILDLTENVTGGRTYQFEAILHVTANATGGSKFAIGGSATAAGIIYQIVMVDNSTSANTLTSRQTTVGGSAGQAGTTSGYVTIKGLIVVSAGGQLAVQFAQNVASGTSSVLAGSTFTLTDIT